MDANRTLSILGRAARRILALVVRPVRDARGDDGVVMRSNRGYGSRSEIFLIGRVHRQSRPDREAGTDDLPNQLRDIGRRISRRPVRGALVAAEFGGTRQEVETDEDGYFRVHLQLRDPPPADRLWHDVVLTLQGPRPVRETAQVFMPTEHCRCVVVSDIDDTVMKTGVANKLKMLWRLFVATADDRTAFPGVAAFYRALHAGASGDQANPMLYVSRAPWGIYDVLDEFFAKHGIPVGPILFLREWGLSWKSPLPRKAEEHKRELVRNMLELYRDLPFVLIGDSGQHDPEGYARIVDENPGRVLAVYIRNVSRAPERVAEIEKLAEAVAAAGSSLLLAAESSAMAEHAAELGLIAPEAVAAVRTEQASEGGAGARGPGRGGASKRVARGDLRNALENGGGGKPPNVVVEEASNQRRGRR